MTRVFGNIPRFDYSPVSSYKSAPSSAPRTVVHLDDGSSDPSENEVEVGLKGYPRALDHSLAFKSSRNVMYSKRSNSQRTRSVSYHVILFSFSTPAGSQAYYVEFYVQNTDVQAIDPRSK